MIRAILALTLCSLLLLAMACNPSPEPQEPATEEGQATAAVTAPVTPAVGDLHTTQPVEAPVRDQVEAAPETATAEASAPGRAQDIGSMRTTQPVQRPIEVNP